MKLLKNAAIGLVALVLLLALGGLLLSSKFTVTRMVSIQAAPDKVYALVAAPRQWKHWSIWNQRDPNMQITYSGPDSGVGAAWSWVSKTEGDGKMTLTAADSPRRVAFDLYFPDFGTTSQGIFTFSPEGQGTKVAWTMNGDMGRNPLFRWLALFADGMVGPDFEAGLNNLKLLAEKP